MSTSANDRLLDTSTSTESKVVEPRIQGPISFRVNSPFIRGLNVILAPTRERCHRRGIPDHRQERLEVCHQRGKVSTCRDLEDCIDCLATLPVEGKKDTWNVRVHCGALWLSLNANGKVPIVLFQNPFEGLFRKWERSPSSIVMGKVSLGEGHV